MQFGERHQWEQHAAGNRAYPQENWENKHGAVTITLLCEFEGKKNGKNTVRCCMA